MCVIFTKVADRSPQHRDQVVDAKCSPPSEVVP